jgi:cyclin A
MSLLDYELLRYVPSMVAASAVLLAQCCLSPAALWNPTLQHYTSYTAADLK